MASDTFGATVRRERQGQKIGLRQFAKTIGVSPTYLSMVERNAFAPPAEDKVRAIAKHLGMDADVLLALAGKVSSDLTEIIRKNPREMASFLRSMKGLPAKQVTEHLERSKQKK